MISTSHAENDRPQVLRSGRWPYNGFWLRELPFGLVLILTLVGVSYTSISKRPMVGYWEFLAIAIGLVSICTGWSHAPDKQQRARLIWTQALHWVAFIAAM